MSITRRHFLDVPGATARQRDLRLMPAACIQSLTVRVMPYAAQHDGVTGETALVAVSHLGR